MQQTKINFQQQNIQALNFSTNIKDIEGVLKKIQPIKYASSRNYKNGAVSKLSPYISRGVISTRIVYDHIKLAGFKWSETEKFIQELAWRDYWQQIWIAKQDLIFTDLKSKQEKVLSYKIPKNVLDHYTTIEAIDEGILNLYHNGYMHNHMRMYVASLCCNIAKCHWKEPSKWMYYHLLDGDLASNSLSWQWVAGSNAKKKYFANQSNINTFFNSKQRHSYLDCDYENLFIMDVPNELSTTTELNLSCDFSQLKSDRIEKNQKTLIYNYYNLDPYWFKDQNVQRIMLLEPWIFKKYPVSNKCIDFVLKLSKNLDNVKLFIGDFKSLKSQLGNSEIIFKEHPLNSHYLGTVVQRDWLSSVSGYYPSFFSFWKKCKKEIQW